MIFYNIWCCIAWDCFWNSQLFKFYFILVIISKIEFLDFVWASWDFWDHWAGCHTEGCLSVSAGVWHLRWMSWKARWWCSSGSLLLGGAPLRLVVRSFLEGTTIVSLWVELGSVILVSIVYLSILLGCSIIITFCVIATIRRSGGFSKAHLCKWLRASRTWYDGHFWNELANDDATGRYSCLSILSFDITAQSHAFLLYSFISRDSLGATINICQFSTWCWYGNSSWVSL